MTISETSPISYSQIINTTNRLPRQKASLHCDFKAIQSIWNLLSLIQNNGPRSHDTSPCGRFRALATKTASNIRECQKCIHKLHVFFYLLKCTTIRLTLISQSDMLHNWYCTVCQDLIKPISHSVACNEPVKEKPYMYGSKVSPHWDYNGNYIFLFSVICYKEECTKVCVCLQSVIGLCSR